MFKSATARYVTCFQQKAPKVTLLREAVDGYDKNTWCNSPFVKEDPPVGHIECFRAAITFYGLCTKQLHLALAGLGDEKSISPSNLVIDQDKHKWQMLLETCNYSTRKPPFENLALGEVNVLKQSHVFSLRSQHEMTQPFFLLSLLQWLDTGQ